MTGDVLNIQILGLPVVSASGEPGVSTQMSQPTGRELAKLSHTDKLKG